MKNTIFTRFLSLLLIFSLSAVLFACKGDKKNENTPAGDTNAPAGEMIDYTVTVKDYEGNVAENAVVNVMKNGEKVKMNFVNPKGIAKFSLESGDYTFTVESANSETFYSYDETKCTLSKDDPNAEITVYSGVRKIESLMFVINDTDTFFDTYSAGVGGSFVSVKAGVPTFFIFTPTESGYYRISSSDPSATVGYHGAPTFPMINNVADMESDGSFCFNIKDSNIGTSGTGTSQYIISVSSDTDTSCVLKIVREGNYIRNIIDEPWQDIMPSKPLEKYVPSSPISESSLKAIDITDASLNVVYNEQDGYYHLGSANGPVVLVRITTASDYIASFTEMCETDRLGAYLYDENGNFLRKESFNELIAKYAEICDVTTGVCPLDKDLAYMIQTVGSYKGWWNYQNGTHIFGDKIIPEKNAWLFACCYV